MSIRYVLPLLWCKNDKPNLPFVSIFWSIWLYHSNNQQCHTVVRPKWDRISIRWIEMWWYGMSWCIGKCSLSPRRYVSIRSQNSSVQATVMLLAVAILVTATRSQKFLKSLFSQLSGGKGPHRWPNIMMRCTVQNTCHLSADILPWPLSPICGGTGEHQEGNVVFSMSSQISWSLDHPRTQVFVQFAFAHLAQEKCTRSGIVRLQDLSVIPSLDLYHHMLVDRPTYR